MRAKVNSKAVLNAICEAAVDAIVIAGRTGEIVGCNKAATGMFGYSGDELLGENVKILMPADMAALHDSYISQYLETGVAKVIGKGREVEGQRQDGSRIPLHLSLGTAEVEDEVFFVAILHDLTGRRAAQNALLHAQKMEAIGRLTGEISHDFNNLLSVIIGNLELLDMQMPGTEYKDLISDALEAASLGAELTSRLLAFSRRGVLSPEILDVNAALDADALNFIAPLLGPDHALRTQFQNGVWQIPADPAQLRAAIVNLVLNAKDAMPDGGEIVLETRNATVTEAEALDHADALPGNYVCVSVADTGHGMPGHLQAHAVEPYFSTKPSGEGTGLGLSIVYGFVKQSGGHLRIRSALGEGTKVSLYFPAVGTEGEPLPGGEAAEDQDGCARLAAGAGQLVLVAEDDASVRRTAVKRIAGLGYRTLEAGSGSDALRLLREREDIAIVFADIVMPGKVSGYDLAEWVRTQRPGVKVLLTSGYAAGPLHARADHAGDVAVLQKPYRLPDLARQLRALAQGG